MLYYRQIVLSFNKLVIIKKAPYKFSQEICHRLSIMDLEYSAMTLKLTWLRNVFLCDFTRNRTQAACMSGIGRNLLN